MTQTYMNYTKKYKEGEEKEEGEEEEGEEEREEEDNEVTCSMSLR